MHRGSLISIRETLRKFDCSSGSSVNLDCSTKIARIVFNNPTRMNSLTGKMIAELADAVDTLELKSNNSTSSLYGVVLSGEGSKSFCAGMDLDMVRTHFKTPESGENLCLLMQDTLRRLQELPLISVAAIEGYALGGGAEIATATDFRFVSEGSTFRFVHRLIGTVPGWGGATRLRETVGNSLALYYLASTDPLPLPKKGDSTDFFFRSTDKNCAVQDSISFLEGMLKESTKREEDGVRSIKDLMLTLQRAGSREESLEVEIRKFTDHWGSPNNLSAIESAIGSKSRSK